MASWSVQSISCDVCHYVVLCHCLYSLADVQVIQYFSRDGQQIKDNDMDEDEDEDDDNSKNNNDKKK